MKFIPSAGAAEIPPAPVFACPHCGDILVAHDNIKTLRCLNARCPAFDRWVIVREAVDA
jgi:hypothetical protein